MATYYFNVHSIRVFERGPNASLQPINIDDLDGAGLTLMGVIERALDATKGVVVDDASAKVRLAVDDVWSGDMDEVPAMNAWVRSGRYGDPFNVRDAAGNVVHHADKDQDASRPTILRFEPNGRKDEVLYASGRYGSHGVFARFNETFLEGLRGHLGDLLKVTIVPVTDAQVLRALLDGATTNEIEVQIPKVIDDPAELHAERRPEKAKKAAGGQQGEESARFVVKVSHSLNLGRKHWFSKGRLASALDSASERKKLARMVIDDATDEALTDAVLRVPVKLKSGKRKVVTLPVSDSGVGGRMGFDVTGHPQTDDEGYPQKDWLAREAHDVLADLRDPTT